MFAIARDSVGSSCGSSSATEHLDLFKEAHAIQASSSTLPPSSSSSTTFYSPVLVARCALMIELLQVLFRHKPQSLHPIYIVHLSDACVSAV
jgi:hypothetical protein